MEKRIEEAINRQINLELWSAYLYLAMSLDAEAKGMKGVATWMYIQWLEEQEHARILQNYMLSRNVRVELLPIAVVRTSWKDIQNMFSDGLEHEKAVSKMVHDLMKMAKESDDFATCNRLQWFIDEQVEEEESMRNIIGMLNLISDSRISQMQYDRWLVERRRKKSCG